MFNDRARNGKPVRLARRVIMSVPFFDGMACFTDEKLSQMTM